MVPPQASTSSSICGAITRIVPGKSWAGSAYRYSGRSGNILEYLQGLPGAFIPAEQLGSGQAAGGKRGLYFWMQQDLPDCLGDRLGDGCIHRKRGCPRDLLETIERGRDDGGTAGERFGDRNGKGFRERGIQEEIGQGIGRRQILLIDPARKVNVPAVPVFRDGVFGPESVAALAPHHELVRRFAVIDLIGLQDPVDVLPGAAVVAR